jgi:uncharacterized repeat protein (TIGR03803 family)
MLVGQESFNGTNGSAPSGPVVLGTDGNFYGLTRGGGANCPPNNPVCGTVYQVTPAGNLTAIYSFCVRQNCADGQQPSDGLIQGLDGNFYGTTFYGGNVSTCNYGITYGCGSVFKITPAGKLTTIYSFCSQPTDCSDGANPAAGLVQDDSGNLYGTTTWAGAACPFNFFSNSCGTVFKITPAGKLTTLHSFCSRPNCADGQAPESRLVLGSDGNLYGTTAAGGANGAGTIFEVTPAGKLITIYSFCSQANCIDGSRPLGGLLQATDGNFYGTTFMGGNCFPVGCGTIFQFTPASQFTTLYHFGSSAADGAGPQVALTQDTDGMLYGTTIGGGKYSNGVTFTLSMGLSPFVKTVPTAGMVGRRVIILGNDMTAATSVTFNGTAAAYQVISATEIIATVPPGATTGTVQVVAPAGTLSSNVVFRIL